MKFKLTEANLISHIKNSEVFASIIRSININKKFMDLIMEETKELPQDCEIYQRVYYIKYNIIPDMKFKLTCKNLLEHIKNSDTTSSIIKSINANKEFIDLIILNTSFLPLTSTVFQRVYYIKNNLIDVIKCKKCTNPATWSLNVINNWCANKECKKTIMQENRTPEQLAQKKERYINTISKKTPEEKAEIIKKSKATLLNKYGVDSYAKTKAFKDSTLERFGTTSPFGLKSTREKTVETLKERYGVDHNFKIDTVIEARKNTWLNNYGFTNPNKNDIIKQKIIDTNNEKYGGNSPMCNLEIQEKSRNTLFKNYGVYYGFHSPIIIAKVIQTMQDRYGYKYVLQNDKYFNNIKFKSYQYKKYILSDNRTVYLQGYEDYALFEILLNKFDIDDILISTAEITTYLDKIWYNYNNIEHRYYPDFYIKSINMIIEVKSIYTYESELEKNLIKKQTCIDKGFNFEFLIIEKLEYNKWKKTFKLKTND